jgi:hypothetical protein
VPGTIARARLRAHRLDRLGRGADEDHSGLLAGPREGGVLGQEAVAGMDRLRAGLIGDLQDLLHPQVALGCRAGAEQVGLVGAAGVRRVAIGLGIHGHGGDAELLQGPHDADRDLAPVGDKDLLEHAGA